MLINDDTPLHSYSPSEIDCPWNVGNPEASVWAHEFSTSGGYADHIFKYAAKELYEEDVEVLEYKNLRYFIKLMSQITRSIFLYFY